MESLYFLEVLILIYNVDRAIWYSWVCKGEFSNPNQEYFSRRAQNKKESKKKKIVLLEDEGFI